MIMREQDINKDNIYDGRGLHAGDCNSAEQGGRSDMDCYCDARHGDKHSHCEHAPHGGTESAEHCEHKHSGEHCKHHECGHSDMGSSASCTACDTHSHSHGEGEGCACCAPKKVEIAGHSHSHGGGLDKKEIIKVAVKVVATVVLLLAGTLLIKLTSGNIPQGFGIALSVLAYVTVGGEYILLSIKNVFKGKFFDENFLMTVASLGALILQDYIEACAVMLLYTLGEALQDAAVSRSRSSVASLLDLKAEHSNLVNSDGSISVVETEELAIGDVVLIKAGERVPADATVIEGESFLDCAALTGEGVPVRVKEGDKCMSGAINKGGAIKARVDKEYADSTAARIMKLVEEAQDAKPKAQKFITKFAKWYTPCVVLLALIVAFIPPIFGGYTLELLKLWVNRALVFLVISCPCALVISIPLSYFAGIGACSMRGVLVKGGNYLETLAKVDTVCTDKTGTLTQGIFEVMDAVAVDCELEEMIKIAAHCEAYSNHPIALSILRAYGAPDCSAIVEYEEGDGGASCIYNGAKAMCGSYKYLMSHGVDIVKQADTPYTVAYVAYSDKYMGYITISDALKPDSADAVAKLKSAGMNVAMLTGDNAAVADAVAQSLGIEEVHAGCMPQDKCAIVSNKISGGHTVAFIGDGLNDAPVLKSASVGVCMGGVGNDASVEASDIVLVNPSPAALVEARKIADKTRRVVIENIVLSLAIKLLIMLLSVTGVYSAMWLAVVADVGVCLVAIFNAMRLSVRPSAKQSSKTADIIDK